MTDAYEYVQNFSDKPIPEPYKFTAEQERMFFDLQRRKHLEGYDDKYKRDKLSEEELAILLDMERTVKNGQLIRVAGRELKFAPGQVYQIPKSFVRQVVAQNPERLRALTWREVRNMETEPVELRFQTAEEAKALTWQVASEFSTNPRDMNMIVEVEDGIVTKGG